MSHEPCWEIQEIAKRLDCLVLSPFNRPEIIKAIRPGFSDSEWLDLVSVESELMPVCCGSISSIRDILLAALREDRWIERESFDEIRSLLNAGGHLEDFPPPNPIGKLLEIRESFQNYWKDEEPGTVDLSDPKDVVQAIDCSGLWEWIVKFGFNSIFSNYGKSLESRFQHNYDLLNVLPVLKTLHEKLTDLAYPPIDAWALVRDADKKLATISGGDLALFSSREDARRELSFCGNPEIKEFSVVPVRVSLEKGLEFLPEAEFQTFEDPQRKATPLETRVAFDHLEKIKSEVLNPHVRVIVEEAEKKLRPLSYQSLPEDTWD